jgi:superfamily II DNA/RNA helicase
MVAHQDSTVSAKPTQDDVQELISRFLRHAGHTQLTALQSAVIPLALQRKDLIVEASSGEGKTGAMLLPLLLMLEKRHEPTIKALILTASAEQVHRIHDQFRKFAPRSGHRPSLIAVGHTGQERKESGALKKRADIILGTPDRIIDHIRRENFSLSDVETAVLDVPDEAEAPGFDKDLQFIYSKLRGIGQTIAFVNNVSVSTTFESLLRRPQTLLRADRKSEDTGESTPQGVAMDDQERFRQAIQTLVKRIKETENPEILNHYRKQFRKHVPLHLRGYISAVLFRDFMGDAEVSSQKTKTMFVSIGKNRRVYPKDLAKLFSDALGIDAQNIVNIKVLDSYSFVDIPEGFADRAIELLNDSEFHGRAITVSHAKKKRN